MLLVMNQRVSVVSKAVCPANVRHSVALGKTAQQRRLFIMLAARCTQALRRFCARYMPAFVMHTAIVRFVKVCFLLFLVSDGVFLCAALYNQFLLLNRWFLFALLSVLLAIALTCLLFDEVVARCRSASRKSQRFMCSSAIRSESVWPQVPKSQWGHSVPLSQMSALSGSQHFPETPLPVFPLPSRSASGRILDERSEGVVPPTPLIRVLETIDLSSTNIEHFLDSKTQSSFFPSTSGSSGSSGIGRTRRPSTDRNNIGDFAS